jgi:hypothetical protein
MAPHLAGRHAAGPAISVDPSDRRADRHFEASRGLVSRQPVALDRFNHSLAKVQ